MRVPVPCLPSLSVAVVTALAAAAALAPLGAPVAADAAVTLEAMAIGSGGGTAGAAGATMGLTVGLPCVGAAESAVHQQIAGFWRWGTSGPAGAADPSVRGLPAFTHLHPNRPNPVRTSTEFLFQLAGRAGSAIPVKLEIHDVGGRRIRRLVDVSLAPGVHRVSWDGRNDHGQRVGRGVYYARLDAGGDAGTRRIVVGR